MLAHKKRAYMKQSERSIYTSISLLKMILTLTGVFFQWIMCSGSMLVGVVVQLIRNQPPFFPLVMTGGVVWTFGIFFYFAV